MEKILARVRNTKGATMADAWIEDVLVADDDLSSWEIINADDDEDEIEDYSFDEADLFVSESPPPDLPAQPSLLDLIDRTDELLDRVRDDLVKHVVVGNHCGYYVFDEDGDAEEEEEEDEDEEEEGEDGYDYDLDDELVPKSVSDRFGRQRMRKLGKRAYPKMFKSKKMPYYYNRSGCVHGKHGLGLKHSIV